LECGKVGFGEVACAGLDVEFVARGLRSAVYGIVFRGGDDLEVIRIVALHPANEGYGEAPGQVRVFAVRFLPTAPARVAEDVDVRRPEGQPLIPAVLVVADRFVVLGARFGGNDVRNPEHQRRIPGGGQPDRLREHGRLSRAGYAVERFIPPV